MKPVLGVTAGEAKTCSRVVSVGQCGWKGGRIIGQLVLLQMLVFTSEGCSKSQSYDASTSTVVLPHSTTPEAALPHTSRPTSDSHKQPCSSKQLGLVGCLNGGSCFMIELHNSSSTVTVAHCSCTGNWSGDRCEYRYVDPNDWPSYEDQEYLKRICIAVGTAAVLLVSAFLISFALSKSKLCRTASSSTVSRNSTTGTNNDQTTSDALIKNEEQKQNRLSEGQPKETNPVDVHHGDKRSSLKGQNNWHNCCFIWPSHNVQLDLTDIPATDFEDNCDN